MQPQLLCESAPSEFPRVFPISAPRTDRANASQDVALIDWDTLFHAVKQQLRSSVEPQLGLEPQAQNTLDLVRTNVLRCVAALDQLQLTMSHHIALTRVLESAVAASQTALAKTRLK